MKKVIALSFSLLFLITVFCSCGTSSGTIKISYAPDKYSPAMSSTPGIALTPFCEGAVKYEFSADKGSLFTWIDSQISDRTPSITVTPDHAAYWAPDSNTTGDSVVKVVAYNSTGKIIGRNQVTIKSSGKDGLYYTPVQAKNVFPSA